VAERSRPPQSLAATKTLFDIRHPLVRAVTAIRNRTDPYWRSMTLPVPEPGIRLIRREQVEGFNRQMAVYSGELRGAVAELDRDLDELKADAARRLGSLFEPSDYPVTLLGCFAVHWDLPNLELPSHLIWLWPSHHQMEEYRVQTRFDEAVRMANQAFLDEFASRVGRLGERLSEVDASGSPQVFHEAAITDLADFNARSRRLNPGSEAQLGEMVALVQQTLDGVTHQRLREHQGLGRRVATQLAAVRASLDAYGRT
jgi:hypothetical protein